MMKSIERTTVKRVLVTTTAGMTAALISVSSFAWWGDKDKKQERLVERVSTKLELTTQQQTSFNEVAGSFLDAMDDWRDQRKDMRDARESEAETFWNGQNLVAEDVINFVKKQQSERVAAMEQAFTPALDKLVAFHATLNERQRSEFADMVADRMSYVLNGRGGKGRHRKWHNDDDD